MVDNIESINLRSCSPFCLFCIWWSVVKVEGELQTSWMNVHGLRNGRCLWWVECYRGMGGEWEGGMGTDHWLEGLTVKMRWGQRRQVGWVTSERTQSTWDLFTRLNLRFPRCQGQVKVESSKFLSNKFGALNLLESWKRRLSGYKTWLLKKAEFGEVSN